MAEKNFELYTTSAILVGDNPLTEFTSVTVARTSGSQRVFTIPKGLSGVKPGPGLVEITVENAVPSSDFEFDPGQFMAANQEVNFTIQAAGKLLVFSGFIETDNFSDAAQGLSNLSFTAVGQLTQWT